MKTNKPISNNRRRSRRAAMPVVVAVLLFSTAAGAWWGSPQVPASDFIPDPDLTLVPTAGSTGYIFTNVVYSGSQYLCVWGERRNYSSYTLFACRVDQAGNLLDRPSLRISALGKDINQPQQPGLASDGFGWLTVWSQESTPGADLDVYGAIISSDGSVTGPFVVYSGPGDQDSPEVAYGDGVYLVVWEDGRKGLDLDDIYGSVVSVTGEVQTPGGVAVCVAPNRQQDPTIASDGTGFMVLWEDARGADQDIYGARVNSTGTVQEPDGYVISDARYAQRLANISFGSGKYLASWSDLRNKDDWDIWGTFIETDGTVIHEDGLHICDAAGDQEAPITSFGASRWLAVWEDKINSNSYVIWGTLVSTDGKVSNRVGAEIWNDPTSIGPKLAFDGNRYLMTHGGAPIATIYNYSFPIGLWLEADGGLTADLGPFNLGMSSNPQTGPTIAADAQRMLVLWEDGSLDESDITGRLFFHSGNPATSEKINFVQGPGAQMDPVIIFVRPYHYLFWADLRPGGTRWGIYGARLDSLGNFVDDLDILVGSRYPYYLFEPDVAAGPDQLVVTWTDWGEHDSGVPYRTFARRLGLDGRYLDPGYMETGPGAYEQRHSQIAYGGGTFMMVWQGKIESGSTFQRHIYANRITDQGYVPDLIPLQVSGPTGIQYYPDIASDGEDFLVVYLDESDGNYRILADRMNAIGERLTSEPLVLSTHGDFYSRPKVHFDGVNYVAVWPDTRRDGFTSDLFLARVTPQGFILDDTGIQMTDGPDNEIDPAMTILPDNQLLIMYSEFEHGNKMSFRLGGTFFNTTGIEDAEDAETVPDKLYLLPNYPNPFNASTTISYGIPSTGHVRLEVYNLVGQAVTTLVDGVQESGQRKISWNGLDKRGRDVPSGLYIYRLTHAGHNVTGKMLYLK
ncbi:T9SS type A sorting domain-containing protein [candidate division KSB1 bacterium]